jgi:hypothetical protein
MKIEDLKQKLLRHSKQYGKPTHMHMREETFRQIWNQTQYPYPCWKCNEPVYLLGVEVVINTYLSIGTIQFRGSAD